MPPFSLTFATLAEFNAWAQHRLAEMEAGLAAMEEEAGGLTETARPRAAEAIARARGWRDSFASGVAAVVDSGPITFRAATEGLIEAWVQFETEMENWAVAGEQKSAAFDARARALLAAWYAAVAGYKAQGLITTGGTRSRLLSIASEFEAEAKLHAANFERLAYAGPHAWLAMGEALKASRQAFERASAKARASFAEVMAQRGH